MRLATLVAAFCILVFVGSPANAQNGRLIEELFRTFAESKLEKERLKRANAEKRPPVLLPPGQSTLQPSKDPYRVELPSGLGRRGPAPPPQPNAGRLPPQQGSINVRSSAARDYAQQLAGFNGAISPLVNELRRGASKHPEIRTLLPQLYQVSADGRALLNRCNGLSSLNTILQPYQDLDARWRQISFGLKSINGLSSSCTDYIARCDKHCTNMCQQLQLQPQFDRRALHNEMMIGATHLQTIIDDLELSGIPHNQCHSLTHDCRLLRQRLLAAANRVNDYSYDEIAQSFTRFVEDWRTFAQQVYGLNNPYLARRLARVSECGDRTYSVLWMTPPTVMHDVSDIAQRLVAQCGALGDRITFRSIQGLPNQDQVQLLGAVPTLNQAATALSIAAKRNADRNELSTLFRKLDQTWVSIEPKLSRIPGMNRSIVGDIERACDEMRHVFQSAGHTTYASSSQLIQVAAALEGTSEYIHRDLQRLSRKLTPSSYRNDVTNGAREFYNHAKELHEEISKPGRLNDSRYVERLQREAQRMIEAWNELSRKLPEIQSRGAPAADARRILRAFQDSRPHVARMAAALLQD